MGLVLDKTAIDPQTGLSLKFPRKIVQVPNSEDFILVDMGGWAPANGGRVFRLVKSQDGRYQLRTLFTKLYLPYDVEVGPDGKIYVGEMGRIFRFAPDAPTSQREIVVDKLPTNLTEPNMHPLNSFSFGRGEYLNDIFVNVGSPTDGCTKSAPNICQESQPGPTGRPGHSSIWQFRYLGGDRWDSNPIVFAKGLRNSMAQVIHSSGTFLQAENGRDLKSANEPHEELNVVEKDRHYGFPYCYNFNATTPEWKNAPQLDCKGEKFKKPWILLPPRAAPLDMIFYSGKMFPEMKDHLLMTWHGYMPTGSRIVGYPTDEKGRPLLSSEGIWTYRVWDPSEPDGKSEKAGDVEGGVDQYAPHYDVTTDWFAKAGLRPNGSVVSLTEASDGSIWIVSDYNKTVTRLSRGQSWVPADLTESQGDVATGNKGLTPEQIQNLKNKLMMNPENLKRWNYIRESIFEAHCTSCHGGFVSEGQNAKDPWSRFEYIMSRSGWVVPGNANQSELFLRMSSDKHGTPMPPSGLLSPANQLTIRRFIDRL